MVSNKPAAGADETGAGPASRHAWDRTTFPPGHVRGHLIMGSPDHYKYQLLRFGLAGHPGEGGEGTLKISVLAISDAIVTASSSFLEINAPTILRVAPASKTSTKVEDSFSMRKRIFEPMGTCVATEHLHAQVYSPTRSCTCSSISSKSLWQAPAITPRPLGIQ